MNIYSDLEEKFLSSIGYKTNKSDSLWKELLNTGMEVYAHLFVSRERAFNRGKELEELTLALTGDEKQAWEISKPYYNYAASRNHPAACYRVALWWKQLINLEVGYADYLEKAARLGFPQAKYDFVYNYPEFRVQTVTKDAWKRKKRQDKVYFQCCQYLADKEDTYAMWKLGTCYIYGVGVKEDIAKGVILREQAMKEWVDLDDEIREELKSEQDFFKEEAIKEIESFRKRLLRCFGVLFD